MNPDPKPAAVNALPASVIVLALVLVFAEIAILAAEAGILTFLGDGGERLTAIKEFGYYAELPFLMFVDGDLRPNFWMRHISYAFVHGSTMQFVFSGVLLLALGKFVGEVFRPLGVLAIFLGAAAGGALLWGIATTDPRPLFGAYPAIFGLVGAYTHIFWRLSQMIGQSRIAAFRLIIALMGIQLFFAVLAGTTDWVADLGGFAVGFLVPFFLRPRALV